MTTKTLVSVVLPCLNEEDSIVTCIQWAKQGLRKLGSHYKGEIIVVDNGSTDRSPVLARYNGAKVITETVRGYGSAYKAGLSKTRGTYIVIADSDGTYDLRLIPKFIKKLERGSDLVLGSRFYGKLKPRTMPFINRYIGNPLLTYMLNVFYRANISDAHTGMRAFSKNTYKIMNLRSSGMEFASEMIVKAIYHKLIISEVPIPYYERLGKSKLIPTSDAWRHIKFMILFAPTYALVIPGFLFFIFGALLSFALLPRGQYLLGWYFDIHTLTVCLFAMNFGVNLFFLGVFAKVFTEKVLKLPSGPLASFLISKLTVERLLVSGITILLVSIFIISFIASQWIASGFGELSKIREILLATGWAIVGAELMFASFFYGLLKES